MPGWLVAVAAATVVASVISFAAVLLWPGTGPAPDGPLDFRRFSSVARIEFAGPSRTTLTTVLGDRGYAASEQGGNLQVVAFDVATGEPSWEQMVTGAGGGVSVAGVAIEGWDGDPFDLGRLPEEVLAQQCAWNERHLVCPDRVGAEIWRFAAD